MRLVSARAVRSSVTPALLLGSAADLLSGRQVLMCTKSCWGMTAGMKLLDRRAAKQTWYLFDDHRTYLPGAWTPLCVAEYCISCHSVFGTSEVYLPTGVNRPLFSQLWCLTA